MKKHPKPGGSGATPQAAIELAVRIFSAGNVQEAMRVVDRGLRQFPDHPVLLNIAGVCARRADKLTEARKYFSRAIAANPNFAEAYNNLGCLLHRTKHYLEAEGALRRAVAIRSDYAEAYNNLGNLLCEAGRPKEAETSYRLALQAKPHYAEAYFNLGNLLSEGGRDAEAEAAFRRSLSLQLDPDAWYKLGKLLRRLKRDGEAEGAYRNAVALRPDAEALNDLACLLQDLGRLTEAEAVYRQALALHPASSDLCNNLGHLLHETRRLPEAETLYRRALALRPDFPEALGNLGDLLRVLTRYTEAEAAFHQALRLRPDYCDAHSNLGVMLNDVRRLDESEACFRRVLALEPGHVSARWNLATLELTLGRFAEGWAGYEIRFDPGCKDQCIPRPTLPFPPWEGQSLAGKTLLVWPEQGFGDEIQFCRYVPLLKARGAAHVTLVCKPALKPLLGTLAGPDSLITTQDPVPTHDYWVPLMSLPLRLSTTPENLPADLPYLRALPERMCEWQRRLPAIGRRVGLAWKGSSIHKNDANRSLPALSTLAPLWSVPDVRFVSLQKGNGEDEACNPPPGQPLLHLGSDIRDFGDSAAIIAQLDLLITVDTALAHVAGALGKPCWVLLPFLGSDWRWMRERRDSPWYPGAIRLFRQTAPGDWQGVLRDVVAELGSLTC
ncbi:MAG: tetratricopeptide repeat protein [Rhodocyclaceae bacterium]|nr:tetratricopeptide repeat protein [Rhodocyclaceae bacterium]